MIKARHVILRPSAREAALLKACQQEAARCWNAILEEEKAFREANDGRWIGKGDFQKRLKRRFALHSQTVQALTDKFAANRDTAAACRRQGLGTRYPWRQKTFLSVPFRQMAIHTSKSGTLQLTLTE